MLLAFQTMSAVPRRKTCRVCGARWPFVSISARGLCPDHTRQRIVNNNTDLVNHSGPGFDHWRRRSLAALGVLVPEPEPDSERAA